MVNTFISLLHHLFTLSPLPLLLLLLLPTTSSSSETTTNLIYKGCAEQKVPDPSGIYSQNLKSLFSSLLSQSSQKAFATTTSGDASGGGGSAITGAYQCRGDLTNSDCYACVSKIPDMVGSLCGADVAAARVQLSGCYLRYQVVGFRQVPQTQLLYKVCGSKKVHDGADFEGKRDSAFGMVENGVKSSGNSLFYTGSYQSLYVLGQCEGDLGNDDCGNCVKSAEDLAKAQCGDSISAQVYLQGCFLSYSFYPEGVPAVTSSSSGGGHHRNRTVAIVVGGLAGLGLLIVILLFLKSALKKKGGKH